MPKTEDIEWNGFRWRRYPDSPHISARNYYQSRKYSKGKSTQLHRAMWEFHHGPIPDGHQIHHINHNPLDNRIENLSCMTVTEHRRLHPISAEDREKGRYWMYTPSGKQRMLKNGERQWKSAPIRSGACRVCGKTYEIKCLHDKTECCSRACWDSHYSKHRVPKESRICKICGNAFEVDKRQKMVCCGRSCGQTLANLNRKVEKPMVNCKTCGKSFTPRKIGRKYCCRTCYRQDVKGASNRKRCWRH